ncbi:MAG TPA: AraC family transcriptional regulator [Planctomycetaceae bacterium]|jgi:AraC family transcriptional regulator|nr:AraC family transcriptional regulator [Planctomycetaceae bacterium]
MCQRLLPGDFLGTVVRRQVCAGLSLTETRHPAGTSLPRHCHERAYFCLIRRGTYREEYGDRQRSCGPHMLAFHPPMEVHAEHFDAEEVCSFNIEITPSWSRVLASGTLPLSRPFDCQAGPALGLAVRILDEFEHFDASSPLIVEGLMLELLGVRDRQVRGEMAPPRWLRNVSDLLRERCTQPWSLTDVAAEAGVHPGYLASAFRRHLGCTIGEFVRRERIALACRALADAETPLADVALLAGFADQSHFTRVFKRQLGLTPAAYRKTTARSSGRSKS